ncbi:MAG: ABC transporter substrate-binding protein [Gammaproteobacteria bacterium]|nr:ABC transporter substrate-binding protein [Gammaproteobacteria bacterium]
MPAISQILKTPFLTGILSLLLLANTQVMAKAEVEAPDVMLKTATVKMLRSINSHRAEIRTNPDKLKSLVEEIILPHLDFIAASKLVMGKYWRQADKTQKINFIRQFRLLLLRFYSSALAEYLNGRDKDLAEDLIHYFPITTALDESSLTVRAELKSDSGKDIPIFYRLHLTSKGWKIFDVSVEGVSMITTYKNNFATELKDKGIDNLIASLDEKNKQLLANNKKPTDKKVQ